MKTILIWVSVAVSAMLALGNHALGATEEIVVNGAVPVGTSPGFINQFELFLTGLYWTEGNGGCSAEFRSDSRIGILGVIGGAPANIINDCQFHLTGAVRTESHVFYTHSGRLWRRPADSSIWAPQQEVPAMPFTPLSGALEMGAMTTSDGRVYWSDSDGGHFDILSVREDGTDPRYELLGTGGRIRKLEIASYRSSTSLSGGLVTAFFILTEEGALMRFDLDPRASSIITLATGITDFVLRQESASSGVFLVLSTGLYAATGQRNQIQPSISPGTIVRINPATGSKRLIHTAAGQSQITSIAADDNAFYIVEQPVVGCGDLFGCLLAGSNLKRQINPSHNGSPSSPYQLVNVTDGTWFNLRSDGLWLYYIAGTQIHRIRTDSPPVEIDVQADHLEVVQAVQNLLNQVQLVANKPTHARGYAHLAVNTTGKPQWFPSARLHGFLNGSELSGSPVSPLNSTAVTTEDDLSQKRPSLAKSFLFELPRHWVQAGDLQLSMTVDESHTIPETTPSPYANNTVTTPLLKVLKSSSPCLVVAPLWSTSGQYDPFASNSGFPEILARAKSLMPVEDFRVFFHPGRVEKPVVSVKFHPECLIPLSFCWPVQVHLSNHPFSFPTDKNWGLFWTAVMNALNQNPGGCPDTHWLGTLPADGQGGFNGVGGARGVKVGDLVDLGFLNGIPIPATSLDNTLVVRMASTQGNDPAPWNSIAGGHTLAHELGHNYGRFHVDQTLSPTACGTQKPDRPWQLSPPYPFDACTIGPKDYGDPASFFGFDPLTRTVVPPDLAGDTMSYASSRWTSPAFWNALLANVASPPPPAPPSEVGAQGLNDSYLLLGGQLNLSSNQVEVLPAHILPGTLFDASFLNASLIALSQVPATWPYRVKLVSAGGQILSDRPLRLLAGIDEPSAATTFLQLMPWIEGTAQVQIWADTSLLSTQVISPHKPTLEVGTPQFDASRDSVTWSWFASDEDGDPLLFAVLYSPDGGSSWQVIDPAHVSQEISVEGGLLPPGAQARFRIIATDGLNSTVVDSAPFLMASHPPKVVISGVLNNTHHPFGKSLTIFGMAYQPGHGTFEDSRLSWSLSGPQALPDPTHGTTLTLSDLSPGHYVLNLTALGPDNRRATNSVGFDIEPMRVADAPAPDLDGFTNDTGYESAPRVRIPLGGSRAASVRALHGNGYLYVAAQDLPYGTGTPSRFEIRVDASANRSSQAQPDDLGFLVDENGIPSQAIAGNGVLSVTSNPRVGFSAVVSRGPSAWSAELRIADALLQGWNHPAGIMAAVSFSGPTRVWPPQAVLDSPATWASAAFGTIPGLLNRAPVAQAGPAQELIPAVSLPVTLDGSGSYDPDGNALSYQWSQISGPSVALSGSTQAAASFSASPVLTPVSLRFRLVVRDGQIASVPSDVTIQLLPGTLPAGVLTGPSEVIKPDGSFCGELVALEPTASRFRVLASSNLLHWVPIATNSANFLQEIQFIDRQAGAYPRRFYRAEELTRTHTVAYSQDFERAVGGEWSPRPLDTTPLAARRFLGQFGNGGTRLKLEGLAPHQRARLEFDLYLIRSWDGSDAVYGPDRFRVSVGGSLILLDDTFACAVSAATQTYPEAGAGGYPPLTGASERGTLGYAFGNFSNLDAVYHFSIPFAHSAAGLTLDFSASGLQDLGDESWGLDNVQVLLDGEL